MTPIWKRCLLAKFFFINLSIHQDLKNNWRVQIKIPNFARFSVVSLSIHPRSRRGAERIRQGEGRWSRPTKMVLERSDLAELFQFREPDTEADTKTPTKSLSPKKKESSYIQGLRMGRAGQLFDLFDSIFDRVKSVTRQHTVYAYRT